MASGHLVLFYKITNLYRFIISAISTCHNFLLVALSSKIMFKFEHVKREK